jgi:branched-subunit amino acid aminotransferase/4-amino-4-deoxychorismate lyase
MTMVWELSSANEQESVSSPSGSMGALYGLHVYTTFTWPLAPRWWKTHWERLRSDAAALDLAFPFQIDTVQAQIEALFQPELPILRLGVTADISHYPDFWREPQNALPSRLWLAARAKAPSIAALRLQTAVYERPMSYIKNTAMAESILLKRKSLAAGANEVLFIGHQDHSFDKDGHRRSRILTSGLGETMQSSLESYFLRECSTTNIFLLEEAPEQPQGLRLRTPDPQRDGCLPGITRLQVLEAAASLGIPVFAEGAPIPLSALRTCQGAFTGNAAQGLVPVQAVQHPSDFPLPGWDMHWTPAAKACFKSLQQVLQ